MSFMNFIRILMSVFVSLMLSSCKQKSEGGPVETHDAKQFETKTDRPPTPDWKNVVPWTPKAQETSVWVDVTLLKPAKKDNVLAFDDHSDFHNEISSSDYKVGAQFMASGIGGKPSLKFDGKAGYETLPMKAGKVFSEGASVVAVLQSQNKDDVDDLFGWGDCSADRFLSHVNSPSTFHFQNGRHAQASIQVGMGNDFWNEAHIVLFWRLKDMGAVYIDGVRVGYAKMIGWPDLSRISPFYIANSPCENKYKGLLSELMLLPRALSETEINGLFKSLSKKYSIPLAP